mgnify:CR=1 FL=1
MAVKGKEEEKNPGCFLVEDICFADLSQPDFPSLPEDWFVSAKIVQIFFQRCFINLLGKRCIVRWNCKARLLVVHCKLKVLC